MAGGPGFEPGLTESEPDLANHQQRDSNSELQLRISHAYMVRLDKLNLEVISPARR